MKSTYFGMHKQYTVPPLPCANRKFVAPHSRNWGMWWWLLGGGVALCRNRDHVTCGCTKMYRVCYYGIRKQMLTRGWILLTDGERCRLICNSIHKATSIGHRAAISMTICIILQWKYCRKEKESYLIHRVAMSTVKHFYIWFVDDQKEEGQVKDSHSKRMCAV